MQRYVRAYVIAIACAAAALAVLLYMAAPGLSVDQAQIVACFATLVIVAQVSPYSLSHGALGTIAFIPMLAGAALVPSFASLAAIAIAVGVAEAVARRPPIKAVFNVAQHTLSLGLGIAAFLAVGGHHPAPVGPRFFAAIAALSVVFLVTNTSAVACAIAMSGGRSVRQTWRDNTRATLVYDLLSLPLVYMFARFYIAFGYLGPVGLAIPLLGVRQLYKTNRDLQRVNQELLQLMVAAIEARDPYTSGHSRRVQRFATLIAKVLGLRSKEVERVGVAALLHDVGKIHEVYAPILRKPDRLTREETAVMQTHPLKSAELVSTVSHLKDVIPAVRHHHEHWDGSGYPDKLQGTSIPIGARIIMIADTLDAMTSDRPYRKALTGDAVKAELSRMSGRQFDPRLVEMLLSDRSFQQLLLVGRRSTPIAVAAVPGLTAAPRRKREPAM